jgi:periplasmic divalent cation tolerance protein
MATDIVVILCTAAPNNAATMAEQLVSLKLVACVSIVPIQSTYRWKGKICHEPEHLMIAKTTKAHADATVNTLKSLHTYDVPEIIVLPVSKGYVPYLDWVRRETGENP